MPSSESPRCWFFLRGLIRESSHWGPFLKDFARTFPDDTLYLLDYPGNGRHFRLKSPWRLDEAVDFLHDEIQSKRAATNILVTISLGGMVGMQWVCKYPEDFHGLVLMNTSAGNLNAFDERLQKKSWPKLLSIALDRNSTTREKKILELTTHVTPELSESWSRIYRWHPVSRLNALRQIVAASQFRIPDQKPNLPILILNGLKDKLVGPQCSMALAHHWDLPLVSHESAGHDLPLEDPKWVVEQIKNFKEFFRKENE